MDTFYFANLAATLDPVVCIFLIGGWRVESVREKVDINFRKWKYDARDTLQFSLYDRQPGATARLQIRCLLARLVAIYVGHVFFTFKSMCDYISLAVNGFAEFE